MVGMRTFQSFLLNISCIFYLSLSFHYNHHSQWICISAMTRIHHSNFPPISRNFLGILLSGDSSLIVTRWRFSDFTIFHSEISRTVSWASSKNNFSKKKSIYLLYFWLSFSFALCQGHELVWFFIFRCH